ncbi:MAG: single-stranded DNA-binding protein, partial [Legionellales bacterium]|nr:single-stranded DNA-binding protein [Legionellales bacterium]
WQDKDNQDRYTKEKVSNEMQILDSKGSNAQNQVTNDYDEFMGKESVQESQPVQAEVEKPEFDDDIPF